MLIGTESNNEFLQALLRNSKTLFAVEVHSISDTEFVLSSPFSSYRIPRTHFVTLAKANDDELKNVIGYFTHTYQYDCNGSHIPSFFWYDLDDIFEADQFEKFRIITNNEQPEKDELQLYAKWYQEFFQKRDSQE